MVARHGHAIMPGDPLRRHGRESPLSGDRMHKGVSKSGNKEVRRLMIELSWLWLRYQPGAKRTLWYRRKWGTGSKRLRRVGIVALSRALLVDIWHWVEHGVVPEGALIKAS